MSWGLSRLFLCSCLFMWPFSTVYQITHTCHIWAKKRPAFCTCRSPNPGAHRSHQALPWGFQPIEQILLTCQTLRPFTTPLQTMSHDCRSFISGGRDLSDIEHRRTMPARVGCVCAHDNFSAAWLPAHTWNPRQGRFIWEFDQFCWKSAVGYSTPTFWSILWRM